MSEAAPTLLSCLDCGARWPATGEFVPTDPDHQFYPDDLFVADEPQSCSACGYHDWGWILQERSVLT